MLEKIKNFYGSRPILWTLLTLLIVAAIALVAGYYPVLSMQADECPLEAPAQTAAGQ